MISIEWLVPYAEWTEADHREFAENTRRQSKGATAAEMREALDNPDYGQRAERHRLDAAARAYLESRKMVVDLTVAARDADRMNAPNARFLDDQLGAWAEHDEDCRRELEAAVNGI